MTWGLPVVGEAGGGVEAWKVYLVTGLGKLAKLGKERDCLSFGGVLRDGEVGFVGDGDDDDGGDAAANDWCSIEGGDAVRGAPKTLGLTPANV